MTSGEIFGHLTVAVLVFMLLPVSRLSPGSRAAAFAGVLALALVPVAGISIGDYTRSYTDDLAITSLLWLVWGVALISLATIAYLLDIKDSDNYWDYLVDPPAVSVLLCLPGPGRLAPVAGRCGCLTAPAWRQALTATQDSAPGAVSLCAVGACRRRQSRTLS